MKKSVILLLVLCLFVSVLSGCVVIEDQPLSNGNNDAVTNETSGSQDDNGNINSDSSNNAVTVEETELYNDNNVIVTVTGIEEHALMGPQIKLRLDNNTDKNITLTGDNFVVNGVTMYGLMSIDVAAGKKANGEITLYSSELELSGIKKIATVSCNDAQFYDSDSYETLFDISLNIETSIAVDYQQQIDETGDVLFQQDGITVTVKKLETNLLGQAVILLIKNETGKEIIVNAENVSVNGYTIGGFLYDIICKDTVRFSSLDLMSSELEENSITAVEEVTFSLEVLDADSYSTITSTDELKVVVGE